MLNNPFMNMPTINEAKAIINIILIILTALESFRAKDSTLPPSKYFIGIKLNSPKKIFAVEKYVKSRFIHTDKPATNRFTKQPADNIRIS